MKAFQKIERMAQQLVTAGITPDINEAIAQVVRENPELYGETLKEGAGATLSEEVSAALSNLTAEDRAVIERKAMEIYLGGKVATENDSYVQAMMAIPGLHGKCIEAGYAIHHRHGAAPSAASLPESVHPEGRAGSTIVSAKADEAGPGEKIRQETRDKLATLAELGSGGPWDKLFEIALQTVEQYPEMDQDEAFRHACEDNPGLFQQWQDSLPKPSAAPATATA